MTKEELATKLNGREYREEITGEEEGQAKRSNLVVIFGASDDLIELRGAINDEVGACDGGSAYIKDGKLLPELDDESEMEALQKHGVLEAVQAAHKTALEVQAAWGAPGYSWFIATKAPYAPFDIMEDDDKFCRGIVIDLKECP